MATGANALFSNTTGKYNTANGYLALQNNTKGSLNMAYGVRVRCCSTQLAATIRQTARSCSTATQPAAVRRC